MKACNLSGKHLGDKGVHNVFAFDGIFDTGGIHIDIMCTRRRWDAEQDPACMNRSENNLTKNRVLVSLMVGDIGRGALKISRGAIQIHDNRWCSTKDHVRYISSGAMSSLTTNWQKSH
ncbi:hypothetical protein AKJ16_DCAP03616 [Drosera capensis]